MQGDAIHRLGRHFVAFLLPFGVALCMGGCPAGGGGGGGGDNDPPPGAVTDTDDDGVRDEDDDCAATPSGATVDAQGCSPSQRDTDGDLVPNADDDCADTPANTTVDERGCPVAAPGDGDADNDGVADSLDQCPNTAADAEVNASGCAASQRDTDSDGVNDDADDCADTPTTVTVDENGCPVSAPGTPDTDGDGVNDDIDQCADTAAGADVDPNGCAVSQRDTDDDGVNDDADTCADTAAGAQVDANGCAASQRDTDGDGVFDDRDDCPDTAPRESVDENGCARGDDGTPGGGGPGGGTAECGNGTVETGEQCEPPNTATCDASCQNIGGGNSNDNCADATPVAEVALEISNVGATTDGPDHPGQCVLQDYTQVDADIWYCFTSPVTEQVIVSLCGSQFDTKVMVYNGCTCPPGTPIACNDDQESVAFNCGTGTDSRVRFPATAQQSYLIRVGGFRGATGDGRLTIFRESDPTRGANACNAQAGACYTEHATPGCNDPASATVCQSTCAVDQFCCDTEWDAVCVSKADGIAHGFSACGAAQAGSCFSAHTSPGCSNESCVTDQPKSVCQAVCEVDPFCCLTEWDAVCVEEIGDECGVFSACRNGRGSCFSQHANAGCNVESCCNAVCDRDPACCNDVWDDVCATIATDLRASGQCR